MVEDKKDSALTSGNRRKRGGWRVMADAPRDGRAVLCLTELGEYEISGWDPVVLCWVSKRGFYVDPVTWQPLPKIPSDLAEFRSGPSSRNAE